MHANPASRSFRRCATVVAVTSIAMVASHVAIADIVTGTLTPASAKASLVNAKGEKFTMEFLIDDPTSERILAPYVKNLRLLGIDATMRGIDPAQHEQRVKEFDFDTEIARIAGDATPGCNMCVYMTGIRAFQKELIDKKYRFMRPGLEDEGTRLEVTVTDPFNNRIRFMEIKQG